MSKHYKGMSQWAMDNSYIQCMGCKGYEQSSFMMWRMSPWAGAVFPYCTEDCFKGDLA
jgi:hypothetical protein